MREWTGAGRIAGEHQPIPQGLKPDVRAFVMSELKLRPPTDYLSLQTSEEVLLEHGHED